MNRLDTLRQKVETLYTSNNPEADVWTDWAYPKHVLVVADLAEKIAVKQGADVEFTVAGALLHDVADAVMARREPNHAEKSHELASALLLESSFSTDEAGQILEEIIKPHSCYEPLLPTTLEGKVMATADGSAHFLTDFYPLFCWRHYGPEDD